MPLDVRTYKCPHCGLEMDRDLNAAINIRNFALRNIFKNTDGTSGINACGVESSGLDVLTTQTKLSTMKQENLGGSLTTLNLNSL